MSRRLITAAGLLAAAGAGAGVIALTGDGTNTADASPAPTATATVERGPLVERETVFGTLGYAGSASIQASAAGVVTRPPSEGSVVRRGRSLYAVDDEPTGYVLYGRLPAWRDLAPGIEGDDVRQLERNLEALGYAPGEVDDDWTSDTTAAVEAFQDDRGLTEDGSLARGEIVFWPGPARVGEVESERGSEARPGVPLATLSTTRREVTVDLDADRQDLAHKGDRVTVDLPDGRSARGVIASVASVATAPKEEGGTATIAVTIRLRGKAARGTRLDRAPVEVGLVQERVKDALQVPVTALLARPGGGFAVEVVRDGARERVPVELGLVAGGRAEVRGTALREGDRVVVPA